MQLDLAAVAVEMSMTQMLHLSYVEVSVALSDGAEDHILLPCFECC